MPCVVPAQHADALACRGWAGVLAGYGMIKWKQEDAGFVDYGLDLLNPDFVKLAESYGCHGYRCTKASDLADLVQSCLAKDGVHVIDTPVQCLVALRDPCRCRRILTRKTVRPRASAAICRARPGRLQRERQGPLARAEAAAPGVAAGASVQVLSVGRCVCLNRERRSVHCSPTSHTIAGRPAQNDDQ